MSSGEEPQMILTFYSPSSRVHLDYICALCVLYLWISIVAFSRIKYLLPETEEACANIFMIHVFLVCNMVQGQHINVIC